MLVTFENFALDINRRELCRDAEAIPSQPQVFDLLAYLVKNRDRVVTKDDLIASMWDGRIVSESTLTSRINAARKAVGDSGEEQRLIRTIAQGHPLCRRRQRRARAEGAGESDVAASAGDPVAPGGPVLQATDGIRIAYAEVGSGAAAGQGRELAHPYRIRLAEPGLESSAGARWRRTTA